MYLLNVKNRTPLCSGGAYLKMNGNTRKMKMLATIHSFNVAMDILKNEKKNKFEIIHSVFSSGRESSGMKILTKLFLRTSILIINETCQLFS